VASIWRSNINCVILERVRDADRHLDQRQVGMRALLLCALNPTLDISNRFEILGQAIVVCRSSARCSRETSFSTESRML
jgi:hypothetical protein